MVHYRDRMTELLRTMMIRHTKSQRIGGADALSLPVSSVGLSSVELRASARVGTRVGAGAGAGSSLIHAPRCTLSISHRTPKLVM